MKISENQIKNFGKVFYKKFYTNGSFYNKTLLGTHKTTNDFPDLKFVVKKDFIFMYQYISYIKNNKIINKKGNSIVFKIDNQGQLSFVEGQIIYFNIINLANKKEKRITGGNLVNLILKKNNLKSYMKNIETEEEIMLLLNFFEETYLTHLQDGIKTIFPCPFNQLKVLASAVSIEEAKIIDDKLKDFDRTQKDIIAEEKAIKDEAYSREEAYNKNQAREEKN